LGACSNERKDEPAIIQVTREDQEMNEAIKTANATLSRFKEALQSGKDGYTFFALKTRFNTSNGGEHIWISDIRLNNDEFSGVVDNLPESTREVKEGDTIQINPDRISDWMYLDNDTLRGGYTIRVLRNRMTEEEKKQFDQENGLIIKD
ncbi:MAG: DUF2314 domain-containing protein, partial [Cytophagaceae bacterium]